MNQVVQAIERLPALPAAASRLIAAVNDDRSTSESIEAIVRYDEALSTLILRLGNSASIGRSGRSFSLRECLTRMGHKRVLRIALEQHMSDVFRDAGRSFGLRRGALWQGSVGGAIAAELIAARTDDVARDEAFLAGLLRDMGKVALDEYYGDAYFQRLAPKFTPDRTFAETERDVLGFDHAAVGAELARKWEFPERYALAIAYHHEPPSAAPDHDPLFDVVHAGDMIALWAGMGLGHDGLSYRLAPHVRDSLKIDRKLAEQLMGTVWERVHEAEITFNATASAREERSA
jgi:putative nucleotidyltransferase with HDIG domain